MSAWSKLTENADWCKGPKGFPLPAYSEFLPPPWLSRKPYGTTGAVPDVKADRCGWTVSEYEEEVELWPGLEFIARGMLAEVMRLGRGEPTPHLSRAKLLNNPYWPDNLAAHAGRLTHERYVLLAGVALSRTQDDKGRVPWTLFGSSEQGPGKAFWRGFFVSPNQEMPPEEGMAFFAELLSRCYDVPDALAQDPFKAGLRILPTGHDAPCSFWDEGRLPSWAQGLLWKPRSGLDGVTYLLTFRPFALLPVKVQEAYLAGTLHLLPFPGSLVFWGVTGCQKLQKQMPLAYQVPLLSLFTRTRGINTLRFLQGGWLHEKVSPPENGSKTHRPHFVRTHRWQKVLRHEDDVALREADHVTRVLFGTEPDDIELYNKPMARNVQIWTKDYRLLLDGPNATPARIARAEETLTRGGSFGYRFLYPAMRVGSHEVYWHRPVAAFAGANGENLGTNSVLLLHAPTGYLTAYDPDEPDPTKPIELWPRFLDRPEFDASIELFRHECQPHRWHTMTNLRSLLTWSELLGTPLTRSLAQALVSLPQRQTLEGWLGSLPQKAQDPIAGRELADLIRERLGPDEAEPPADEGLTFDLTATRIFEETYWQAIADLAHGQFRTKCVADCVRDTPTRTALATRHRDLDALAKYLVSQHKATIKAAGIKGAWVAEHRFSWQTDFAYPWMGGWDRSQRESFQERNLIVRIPGRDSSHAVILADHYDTAYMHDRYYLSEGGTGARLAAAGADDNHSATAALLLAAPILLELSRQEKLGCDIWLVHLTGEEFPSDCLGARHLSRDLVQGTLHAKEPGGANHDLSGVRIRGLFVADMIAHNNERSKHVFQMAPGEGVESARLAIIGHETTLAWNALARKLNRLVPRRGAAPAKRSNDPAKVPAIAPHPILRGEVRPDWDPRSTLFNTDGQIFSDVGVPAVLFMEDYDINRKGYHDTHDTMENIDLDYGSAVAAVFIETGVRAAR